MAYVSVTVCNPGSTTACATIPDVQVDTGSSGLRLLASAPGLSNLALTPVGSSVYECYEFSDTNYLWGQVEQADVLMAGEKGSGVPIQVISSGNAPSNTPCGKGGGDNLDSTVLLQANGILGIGPAQQDCGAPCTGTPPPLAFYWLCSSASSCPSPAGTTTQVSNPVASFLSVGNNLPDNNGIMLTMSQVAATGAASATGTLTFGIGTQSDNALSSSAQAYAIGVISYNSIRAAYPAGSNTTCPVFVESGQGLNYFLDAATVSAAPAGAGIVNCPAPDNVLYCPTSVVSLPFTAEDGKGDSAASSISVGNGISLLSSSVSQGGSNTAFSNLTGGAATMPKPPAIDYVVLGMPFFYGKTVYVGIAGKALPTGLPSYDAALGYVAF
jgi:hypothetical protein